MRQRYGQSIKTNNQIVVALVISAFVGILLILGMLYFFLPMHRDNLSTIDGNRGGLARHSEFAIADETVDPRDEFDFDDITVISPERIKNIIGNNYVNIGVIIATLLLIGLLAYLLKKSTDMRAIPLSKTIKDKALEAVIEANELYKLAQDMVLDSKSDPNNIMKENDAVQSILDTGEAIDKATILVDEYKDSQPRLGTR